MIVWNDVNIVNAWDYIMLKKVTYDSATTSHIRKLQYDKIKKCRKDLRRRTIKKINLNNLLSLNWVEINGRPELATELTYEAFIAIYFKLIKLTL